MARITIPIDPAYALGFDACPAHELGVGRVGVVGEDVFFRGEVDLECDEGVLCVKEGGEPACDGAVWDICVAGEASAEPSRANHIS